MSGESLTPLLLLALLSVPLAGVISLVFLLMKKSQECGSAVPTLTTETGSSSPQYKSFGLRPGSWLAIKSQNLQAVQFALGLHNPKPCTWLEGVTGGESLVISSPVRGWILVTGSGLPEPGDDVDACFRFLVALSRKVGQIQFFSVSRALNHHAWVQASRGRIQRAYAWAGRTLWNQGKRDPAERDLELKCFDYFEATDNSNEVASLNTERVPLLAARWSLDPATLDDACVEGMTGIAGEVSRQY